MRLGVLDVGSNTVHLLVVDAHRGARPLPAFSHKAELRLGDHLDPASRLSGECTSQLRAFVDEALRIAEDKGVQQLLAFATSAVRDAVNGDEVLARIEAETKVHIQVLPGRDESRLTFLAARRWFGWSSGRLLMLDIGGGSLEIASGYDEGPDVAISLPLGGGRLTRDWLAGDPPSRQEARQLRKHVRAEIAATAGAVMREGPLHHADVTKLAERLSQTSADERAQLPGVSHGRAPQLAAGAIVADAAMDLFGLPQLEICPWALREGVILRRLDAMPT